MRSANPAHEIYVNMRTYWLETVAPKNIYGEKGLIFHESLDILSSVYEKKDRRIFFPKKNKLPKKIVLIKNVMFSNKK